jgi:uridine kinase
MNHSLVEALSPQHNERKIVTIDGPAGSGKTTLASALSLQLEIAGFCVEVIHMDDLYNGWERALSEELTQTLQSIVEGYRGGEVSYNVYDWHQKNYTSTKTFLSPDVLILEGVGSGQRAIRYEIELAIWIEVEPQLALQRVIERDGKAIHDIQAFMVQWSIDQAAHFHNEGTQGAADYCIDGAP